MGGGQRSSAKKKKNRSVKNRPTSVWALRKRPRGTFGGGGMGQKMEGRGMGKVAKKIPTRNPDRIVYVKKHRTEKKKSTA